MAESKIGVNIVISLVSAIAAIASAFFAIEANKHSETSADHAFVANNISKISSRSEACFVIAEHYYKFYPNELEVGAAHFTKAREFIKCGEQRTTEDVSNCIQDVTDNFKVKDQAISC